MWPGCSSGPRGLCPLPAPHSGEITSSGAPPTPGSPRPLLPCLRALRSTHRPPRAPVASQGTVPIPRLSAPTWGEACITARGGREGSRVCQGPEAAPSWKDQGPWMASPAKSHHLPPGTSCLLYLDPGRIPPLPRLPTVPALGSWPPAPRDPGPLLGRPRGPRSQGTYLGDGESSHPTQVARPYRRGPGRARTRAGR